MKLARRTLTALTIALGLAVASPAGQALAGVTWK